MQKLASKAVQFVASLGLFGCATLAFLPLGCASNVEVVPVRQGVNDGTPGVSEITVERFRECFTSYSDQLEAKDYEFWYKIRIDGAGRKQGVTSSDIPATAPDFGACSRSVLRDMAVPTRVVSSLNGQTVPTPELLGTTAIVEPVIEFGRIFLRAGGTTILLVISIELAVSGVRDIAEAVDEWQEAKRKCHEQYLECLESPLASKFGSVYNATRCLWCRDSCVGAGGAWPPRVPAARGTVTCKY